MRLQLFAIVVLALGCGRHREPDPGARAPGPTKRVDLAQAERLWKDGELFVGRFSAGAQWAMVSRWAQLSRGSQTRKIEGAVAIGAYGGRAYVTIPGGEDLELMTYDVTGEPTRIGRMPQAGDHQFQFAVTSTGEVAAIGVAPIDRTLQIMGKHETRQVALPAQLDTIDALLSDPQSSRVAVIGRAGGLRTEIVIDTAGGTIVSRLSLPNVSPSAYALDGRGSLWLALGEHGILRIDEHADAQPVLPEIKFLRAYDLVVSADGSGVAYLDRSIGNDMGHLPWSQVFYARVDDGSTWIQPVARFDPAYDQMGMAIDGDTLWIAATP